MEITVFLILTFIVVNALMLYSIFKFRREQAEQIEKVITDNLLVLKPENRYIISFPFEISDEDFDEVVEKISNSLDLENSDTHVVIVQGQVTMIEFS